MIKRDTGSGFDMDGRLGRPIQRYVFPFFSARPIAWITLRASYTRLLILSF